MTQQNSIDNFGYIKLHRKIINNPIFLKPNYLSIWIYLLLNANHTDKYIILNNKKTLIKRGTFIGSLRKISKGFKISISTVHSIIKYLKSEQMIEHVSNPNYSIFTISRYDDYQKSEHLIEHEPNTSRTRAETTNNEKNNKNIIKEKINKKEKAEYGEFKNIKLTKEEYEKLIQIYKGNHYLDKAIIILGNYIKSKGKKYKSHYAVLNKHNWVYKKLLDNDKKCAFNVKKSVTEHNREIFNNEVL